MPTVKTARHSGHHAFGAADAGLDERRQQRQRHEADQPEPGHDVRAAPQAPVGLQLAQQRHRGCPGVAVMARPGAAGPAAGMARANAQDATASARMTTTTSSGLLASATAMPPAMVPIEDGEEGRAFDQRVAGGQLGGLELLRQHAVFHRPEQRGDDAEQPERHEQDRHRVQEEADAAKPATGISASLMRWRRTPCRSGRPARRRAPTGCQHRPGWKYLQCFAPYSQASRNHTCAPWLGSR